MGSTRPDQPRSTLRLASRVDELDPQLARAYVGLAEVHTHLIDLGLAPSVEEALAKQMEAAQKAVTLDPNDGKAHLALGEAYAFHGKPEQAVAEFDRAETLAPSDADVLVVSRGLSPFLVKRRGQ